MESTEVCRDLLDVIDVPDLTEDERQAMMKRCKDKGTKKKRSLRDTARELIECIEAVENISTVVYDTYPQVVVKMVDFLARDGVTKTMMCEVLGGIYQRKLSWFLSGANVNKCGKTYKAAYLFLRSLGSWRTMTRVRIERRMRRRIPADFIKYTEMGGKEEIDVLAMKLDLNIMVGGTVHVIIFAPL